MLFCRVAYPFPLRPKPCLRIPVSMFCATLYPGAQLLRSARFCGAKLLGQDAELVQGVCVRFACCVARMEPEMSSNVMSHNAIVRQVLPQFDKPSSAECALFEPFLPIPVVDCDPICRTLVFIENILNVSVTEKFWRHAVNSNALFGVVLGMQYWILFVRDSRSHLSMPPPTSHSSPSSQGSIPIQPSCI
ncbi:hypothetical protein CC80DRAFT_199702 [Byssothecium circinans]|uniref:Uncharacterized protein n=1 Tax=Byssothecium circinans TaxID=147558 RepID=A0A6A5UB21_9PLEO|nr:hypothetical protein CC80DRAFT_199702 [Byssothecium circinans]